MSGTYDAIVIGLGAMGSAATCHLAKRGHRVLGLDMFGPSHDQGSSHGEHRMIRRSTGRSSSTGRQGYLPLAARAFDLWDELERESGRSILRIIGEVWIGYPQLTGGAAITRASIEEDPFREYLTEQDLAERFPGFRLHDGMLASYEADAGYLRPEVGIAAHLQVAERHGAEIQRPEEVTSWAADGDGVTVETKSGSYSADRLIITTGPWAAELLGGVGLPLRVIRIVNGYFDPAGLDHWHADNGAPDFLLDVPEGGFYGMPATHEAGLKIGLHDGPDTNARTIRREIDDEEIQFLTGVLDRYMPGASGPLVKKITCMYTMTPDEDFIIERHAGHPQVVYGCGFSGRGFKFSPAVGEILADLAIDGTTRHDIEFLSSARFERAVAS